MDVSTTATATAVAAARNLKSWDGPSTLRDACGNRRGTSYMQTCHQGVPVVKPASAGGVDGPSHEISSDGQTKFRAR